MDTSALRDEISKAISSQQGVLFAKSAIVHRGMYAGRGIIAPNSEFKPGLMDSRGYLPVEWWIMSKTEAKNAIAVQNEGITSLLINGKQVLLTIALAAAEKELMGDYARLWPLTKVLDIGGVERKPNYTDSKLTVDGDVVGGRCVGHGKTEAYFFPPVNVPPYNLHLTGVKTRLGLKPEATEDKVLQCLGEFGCSDDLYSLLMEYEVRPWESWTIEQKVIHAPGPWPTFEIQLPQDDFHLLAWQLGESIGGKEELRECRETYHLRGLPDDRALLNETLDWETNVDHGFRDRWWRQCEVMEEGQWGKRLRLFYHLFYGEGFVVQPGESFQREKTDRPFAGITWSGRGLINGHVVDCLDAREFLVTPNHAVIFENTSNDTDLIVFTVFPLTHYPQ